MTTFGTGQPDLRRPMNLVRETPRRMETGQLAAPGGAAAGYVPVPADFAAAEELDQLAAALGMAGQAFGQAAEQVAYQRARTERAERGAGARYAASQWPVIEEQIRNRELLPPNGSDPIEWANILAEGIAPENASPAFIDELKGRLQPVMTAAALKEQAAVKEESQLDLLGDIADSLAGQSSTAAFTASLNEATAMGIDREKAIIEIGTGAAAWAAESGDLEAWNAALGFLEGRNQLKIERLRGTLNTARRQNEIQVQREASNEVDSALLRARDPDTGTTYGDARSLVEQLREEAGDTWALDRLHQIDAIEAADSAGARREAARAYDEQQRSTIIATAAHASLETDFGLGLAAIPEDGVAWINPEGQERRITAAELKREAQRAAFKRLDERTDDPAERFAGRVQWLAGNGETSYEWKSVLETGAGAASAAFLRREGEGQNVPKELPASVAAGYELSKQLRAVNPQLWARHMSAEAQEFYVRAEAAEMFTDRGDVLGALTRAAQVPEGWTRDPIAPTALDQKVKDFDETVNVQDVRAHVRQVAELLMRSPGLGKDAALEQAAAVVTSQYRTIRGVAVWTGNAAIPANIDAIAESAAQRYAESVAGTPYEVRAKDLTLVPMRDGDAWILYDRVSMRPVDKWRHGYAFTNREINEMNAAAARAGESARDTALREAWERIRPIRVNVETPQPQMDLQDVYDGNEAMGGSLMSPSQLMRIQRDAASRQRNREFEAARREDPAR